MTEKSALVYCRISSNRRGPGTSLESQKTACIAHAAKLGYAVAQVTEEVFSGADLFGRPKLMRDLKEIRKRQFQALIVYSVDRLTRNTAHLAILMDECKRANCCLIFVTGDGESSEAYAADVEREQIGERTSRGWRTKLRQGRPLFNGWNLYGYRPDQAAGVYLIYEPEARIVRRIFSMYAEGHGMHRITSIFNKEGLPSPKSDKRPHAKWSSSAISFILNSRSYMGEEIRLKTKHVARNRDLPRPESERVRMPDGVRPLSFLANCGRPASNRFAPALSR
jgi:site-specific DNA recombinase